ncbi:Ubiquinone biosynthesis protein coq4, mitochondrial [Hondaea fermentalgiana]|uniref:Ubiquinone biosynthesis protein COQ4 homolog, mitochondrial n=1 Tax=Hondaea fermentalgiana TaxID=2315210 RepID=A0A2R5GHU0_9STRA|nr:Ubiquinone biosynthesis protein coq4, mitochondrial [Hondaea fermentalgiana]|eukprot:GBG30155.1 Ubiquinone biosynthesis protein coq4, mitochondrial [Hondaea fermentalgiana]
MALSGAGRLGVAVREALRALRDPYLGGESVAAVAEATGDAALREMRGKMMRHETGRRILRERPVLEQRAVDFARLEKLPADTVGGAFAAYLNMHGFEFGTRPQVRYVEDPELAYIMQRYRDTHDLLHAICGVPVSVSGEVALKWFEMVQTGLPMTALAAFAGGLRAEPSMRSSLLRGGPLHSLLGNGPPSELSAYVMWCVQMAKRSDFFLNIYFEECWEEPLPEMRKRVGLRALPESLASLDASWEPSRVPLMRKHYEMALQALGPGLSEAERARRSPFETYLQALDAQAAQRAKEGTSGKPVSS